jgi:hypothetical protein
MIVANGIPMLIRDDSEAQKYRTTIIAAGQRHKIPTNIIIGIMSRESACGLTLRPQGPTGTGDWVARNPKPEIGRPDKMPPDGQGFGRGLMQIDYDAHEFARTGEWWEADQNIDYGCLVLFEAREFISSRIEICEARLLSAYIAAYNAGPGRIVKALQNQIDPDMYTTGRDYSKVVIGRANFFREKGWV